MQMIKPVLCDCPETVIVSNVPITEIEWSSGTYSLGTQRYVGTQLYEVVVSSTSDDPETGSAKPEPTWVKLGAINRFRMFDEVVGARTTNPGTISVEVTPNARFNALAVFGAAGSQITVEVEDPQDGIVYSETRALLDFNEVTDWFAYFFSEPVTLSDFALFGLPNYLGATLKVVISAVGDEDAECGELVVGTLQDVGTSHMGARVGIEDFSRKERDDFGGFVVIERAFSKRGEFSVTVEDRRLDAVAKLLANMRATPAVWVADERRAATLIYGYVRDWGITYQSNQVSEISLDIEGLT